MESILSQTYTNLEVLAIDAGSTDGTLEILKEYEKKDFRVKVVVSQKRSYGYQVNMGISMASGNYIGIVESDDYIAQDMYETLYNEIIKENVDYVKASATSFWEILSGEYRYTPICVFGVEDDKWGKKIVPKNTPELEYRDRYLWLGLYRSSLLKRIKLNESDGAAYQDIGFSLQLHTFSKSAIYLKKQVYYYRIGHLSASGLNRHAFRFLLDEYIYCKQWSNKLGDDWKWEILNKLLDQTISRFRFMAISGFFWEEQLNYILQIKDILKEGLEDKIITEDKCVPWQWSMFQLLLESPYAVYGVFAHEYNIKRHQIKQFKNGLNGEDIVLFGCGKKSAFFHAMIQKYEMGNIRAYCDNKIAEKNKCLRGVQVLSVETTVKLFPYANYVITSRKYSEEMTQQLKKMKIPDKKIKVYEIGEDESYLRLL